MADTKTSALTELAGTAVVAGDWIPIVDTNTSTTKKLDASEVADLPNMVNASSFPDWVAINLGSPGTAIDTTGAIAGALWFPPWAITVTAVHLYVGSATTTGTLTLDINEAGTSILSTKLTIDATETTSSTAATAAVISDSSIAAHAKVSFDWDGVGDSTATDAIVVIEFTRDVS